MRGRVIAEGFACHTIYSPKTTSGIQAQPTQDEAQQQANAPNFSPQGGGGIAPPAPTQQPPPVWGAPPTQGQDAYQQKPPRRSPYA